MSLPSDAPSLPGIVSSGLDPALLAHPHLPDILAYLREKERTRQTEIRFRQAEIALERVKAKQHNNDSEAAHLVGLLATTFIRPTKAKSQSSAQSGWRAQILHNFGQKEESVECCVLGAGIPASNVIAVHIIRRNFEPISQRLWGVSFGDVRNGLLLYKPIADAADQGKLVFLGSDGGRFYCKVLDPALKAVSLGTKAQELLKAKFEAPPQAIGSMTFEDLDGMALDLSKAQSPPLRRALALLAVISLSVASKQGWFNAKDIDSLVEGMLSEGDTKIR